jgi:GDP-4-dehydro-6-deoxy-D-mannose reductase
MKKIFFTGANGFLGTHLMASIRKAYPDFYIHQFSGVIENFESLKSEFEKEQWDIILHFAGMSHVVESEKDPQKAYEVNTLGTIFLCQLMNQCSFKGKLYFTSTAQVYESAVDNEVVIYNETSKVCPQNLYARTKYLSEGVLEAYSKISNSNIKVLRLFNHTHKSQSPKFLLPSVYTQIQAAKNNGSITVGNLDLERDFSLISDFVSFFIDDLPKPSNRNFEILNLSSGVPRNLKKLVQLLISKSGKNLKIEMNPSLLRPNDPKRIIGDFKTSYKNHLSDEDFIDAFLRS